MSEVVGANLERLMAAAGLSIAATAARTGLDVRTLRGILRCRKRPRMPTLRRLAEGLGVPVDELLIAPIALRYRTFDRDTNPAVEEALRDHPRLFANWTVAEFEELTSHFGAGGGLTREGVLAAARRINDKRQLHLKLDLLLESTHASLITRIVEAMHKEILLDGSEEQNRAER